LAKAAGRAWRGSQPFERVQARSHAGCSELQKNVCKAVGRGQKAYQSRSFSGCSAAHPKGKGHRPAAVRIALRPVARHWPQGIDQRSPDRNWPLDRGGSRPHGGEHFLLNRGCFRQLLVHMAGWPICRLRDRSVMFFSAATVTRSQCGEHGYAGHCYQNAQALVAWLIAPVFQATSALRQSPANGSFQRQVVLYWTCVQCRHGLCVIYAICLTASQA